MRSIGSDQRQENSTDGSRGAPLSSASSTSSTSSSPSASPSLASSAPSATPQPAAAPIPRPVAPIDERAAAAEHNIAVLGPTLRFRGDLSAEEDFILQGRIEGSINHTQRIIVGTGGVVIGNVYARVVVVDGTVEGDLHGMESVTVHETGRVIGSIFAPRVGLVDGAFFNGRIDMSGTSVANQVANPGVGQVAGTGVSQGGGNSAARRRVDNPSMSPGLPMSAEDTERVLTPKVVSVLPPPLPPPSRERLG